MALDTFTGSLLSVRLSLLLSSRYMQASKMESSNCFGEKMEVFLYAALNHNLLVTVKYVLGAKCMTSSNF